MERFRGRVAAITGAASGIGRALAVEAALHGARLALADVDETGLTRTAQRCRALGAEVDARMLDVRDREAVTAWAAAVVDRFGSVFLVVNNAGVALSADAVEMAWEDLEFVLDVDLWGVLHGSQAFLPHLERSGGGHLVNVSSLFGLVAMPSQSAYNAAKFAVRGYTEALAMELEIAGSRVQAHCVHPGGIATDIARNARHARPDEHAATAELFDRLATTSPERAATIILRGVARGRRRILVGVDAWIVHGLQQVLGARYQRVVAAAARRALHTVRVNRETPAREARRTAASA